MEVPTTSPSQLQREYEIYPILKGIEGIIQPRAFDIYDGVHCLLMLVAGKNIGDCFIEYRHQFTHQVIAKLGIHVVGSVIIIWWMVASDRGVDYSLISWSRCTLGA